MEFTSCPDCGSEHLGGPCGMTFAERLRSVQVSRANWDTAERHRYYDDDMLTRVFGEDERSRKERMMEETKGVGYTRPGADGRLYHRDRHGDVVALSEREEDRLVLAGDTETEAG